MMKNMESEIHPLPPFLPERAKILMLGSFPPPKERWKMDFFYPNIQNDMWRIFGWVFFDDSNFFLTDDRKSFRESAIRSFLTEKGIALWDTAMEVRRQKGNASDKFLEVLRPVNLEELLSQIPECRAIVITGQKSMDTLLTIVDVKEPAVGHFEETTFLNRSLRIYRMPSSSRAYPKPLAEKAAVYRGMFEELGMINQL
jgi:G:T/U-mismatch repair DNA glycosylase